MRVGGKIKRFFGRVGKGLKTIGRGVVKAVGKAGGAIGTAAGAAIGSIVPGA